jgi:hypothetical protein
VRQECDVRARARKTHCCASGAADATAVLLAMARTGVVNCLDAIARSWCLDQGGRMQKGTPFWRRRGLEGAHGLPYLRTPSSDVDS